ncbi:MAG: translation initiation factor IF-3 [Patescibacteria group bacterium]
MKGKQLKFYKINYQIQSPTIRLLDDKGAQIGIVSKIEALQKAKELGLDVVEVASSAKPPVAKLIDYKKFKYQEAKKEQESKKTQKNVGVKEIRLRPFIGQHDFDTRLKRAKEFLDDGNQVKITVLYKGRELGRKQFGFEVLTRFIKDLGVIKVVREPRMEGRSLAAMVVNDKKGEGEEEKINT